MSRPRDEADLHCEDATRPIDPGGDVVVAGGGEQHDDGLGRAIRDVIGEQSLEERVAIDRMQARLFDGPTVPLQVGRYVVLEQVARGGMGVVYAAYDPQLDRKVALKVLNTRALRDGDDKHHARLLREAQAMAQVSHPNVVQVHDVGIVGEGREARLFIAMELVAGVDLRAWLHAQTRTWREVLSVFVAAARGLASAHAVGLIHRDFKPSNVLVGDDGRVRVLDFGLARLERAAELPDDPVPPPMEPSPEPSGRIPTPTASERMLESPLTEAGTVVGTPPYMAPEQHLGKPGDARSDIYAFGVALYEALYGVRPFTEKPADALLAAKQAGAVPDPPEGSEVPGWLRAQVLRCLAADPSGRPDTVADLLAGLERDPHQRRRRTLVGIIVATVVIAAAYGLGLGQSRAPENACADVEAELSGIWDEPTKERIRGVFVATGKPFAVAAWEGAAAALDARAEAWLAARQQECEASARRTRQTPAGIESRICLDRRLKETAEITRLFLEADAVIVENAITVASSLPPVGTCEEAGWHSRMGTVTVPSKEGDAFESLIARARVLRQGGKYPEGKEAAMQALALAENGSDARGEARALVLLGALQDLDGRPAEAETTLRKAAVVAERAGDDRSAAEAWTMLIRVVGRSLVRPEEGLGFADLARAKIARTEDDPALVVALDEALGTVLYVSGSLHSKTADLEAARDHYERVLEERTRTLGRDHPRVGAALVNLASILEQLGDEEAATEHLREGAATLEAALGPGHPSVGKALNNLGASLLRHGRLKEAEEVLVRTVSVLERALGSDHPVLAQMHMNLGYVTRKAGRLDDAEHHARRALQLLEGAHGVKHPTVAVPHRDLAVIAHMRGDHQLALEEYERARTISTAALGPESVGVGHALLGIGTEQLHLGRSKQAAKSLEQCVAIYDTISVDAASRARSRFMLARATLPTNPKRARALAKAAREQLVGSSTDVTELRGEIDAWLAGLD